MKHRHRRVQLSIDLNEMISCGPYILLHAFPLDGAIRFLFIEKYDFYKRLGVATYFYFIFKGKKQNKKEKTFKCDS